MSFYSPQLSQESDEQLCKRIMDDWDGRKSGPDAEQAFEVLYHRHFPRIRGLVMLLLGLSPGIRQDADFVSNGAMMRLLQSLRRRSYDPAQAFLPYFRQLVRNYAKDHLKQKRLVPLDEEVVNALPGKRPSPLDEVLADERPLLIAKVMQGLPEECEILLKLQYLDGLSKEEIQEQLGLNADALRGRMFRAKQRFRKEYERLHG